MLRSAQEILRQKDCHHGHLFDYPAELMPRDRNGNVSCRCARCGKVFIERCGVDLVKHGDLVPLYQYGRMYA